MNESDLENELRSLRPATPSPDLEQGIARALQAGMKTSVPGRKDHARRGSASWIAWVLERLAWSTAGAMALWMLQPSAPHVEAPSATQDSVVESTPMTEQPVAVNDEGVTFLENGAPARLVRYLTMEHHPLADGAEVRMPREDVIVLPVKMQ